MSDESTIEGGWRPWTRTPWEAMMADARYAVYQCMAVDGTVLYVGFTGRGGARLADHTSRPWWPAVDCIRISHYETEGQARAEEVSRIRDLAPLFNVAARGVGAPAQMMTMTDFHNEVVALRSEVERLRVLVGESVCVTT